MKKKQFLVMGVKTSGYVDEPISVITESTDDNSAIQLVSDNKPEWKDVVKWFAIELTKVERIKQKDITIREVMQTAFSEEQLIKTIKMYEDMLLKGINFKTLGEIFAPYLIMYDPKLEECIVSKSITRQNLKAEGKIAGFIMDVGFRFLPKTFKPFDKDDTNFKLWYQKTGNFHGDNFKLVLKQGSNGDLVDHKFVDFVLELSKIIPDVPVRLEKVVIQNL